jgi:acyl carrier protein
MSIFLYYLGQILILLALLALIGIPVSLWEGRKKKKKIEQAFADRDPLDEHTFYEKYFRARAIPSDVVSKVRHILEDELNADMSRLAAEDDFRRNLSFFWKYDSMADVEIVMRLEEEFCINISDAEAEHTSTVLDIVNLVWGKLRPREA